MTPTLQYLRYLGRHKRYVYAAGVRLGVPRWRLLLHDWSKFLPSEFGPYKAKFYGRDDLPRRAEMEQGQFVDYNGPTHEDVSEGFDRAWLLHQNRQPHHWQFWLLVNDRPGQLWSEQSYDGGMTDNRFRLYRDGADPHKEGPAHEVVCDFREFRHPDSADKTKPYPEDKAFADASLLCDDANRGRRVEALPMPEVFVREMVADWAGAGRAITGAWEVHAWYRKNKGNMVLHPETRALVERLLDTHDFDDLV